MGGDGFHLRMRSALELLFTEGELAAGVRDEIRASWLRSAGLGLRPEHFDVPHDLDLDTDGPLATAAGPVLDQLVADLAGTDVGIVLTDGEGHVLVRRVETRPLGGRFDRIFLAPGFVYAEGRVGTNAIGTALEQRVPSFVAGGEHFADALTAMACAAAPISDPRTGRVLGAIDLTCALREANDLMLPFAKRAARDIEGRLVDDARMVERVLLQRFLRERRRAKGPMVFVGPSTMIANAAADRLVEPHDELALRDWSARLLREGGGPAEATLSNGTSVLLRCEAVVDGGVVVGALLRLQPTRSVGPARPKRPYGWESLTDTERSVVDLVAQGCTNRQAAERLFLSPYTVDFHLRSIYRKLDVTSRVDLTRAALGRMVALGPEGADDD